MAQRPWRTSLVERGKPDITNPIGGSRPFHKWIVIQVFLQRCSGIAVPTVFGVLSDVSCRDRGRACRAWSGLVGMEAELGHSLTHSQSTEQAMWALSQTQSPVLMGPASDKRLNRSQLH